MPALKPHTIWPTPDEDAAIAAAAVSDPDSTPLTEVEWAAARPTLRTGRPQSVPPLKVPTTIRLDADVLDALKTTGKGWQTRLNDAMREWARTHLSG